MNNQPEYNKGGIVSGNGITDLFELETVIPKEQVRINRFTLSYIQEILRKRNPVNEVMDIIIENEISI